MYIIKFQLIYNYVPLFQIKSWKITEEICPLCDNNNVREDYSQSKENRTKECDIFHKNVMFIKTKVIKLMSCSSKLKKIEQSMVRHE
jgi:hypothetical protein